MKIGVLSLQGDVTEHINATKKAATKLKLNAQVLEVKGADKIKDLDGLIMPGGESTTMNKLMDEGLRTRIKNLAKKGAIWGTCAGCILLSKDAGEQAEKTATKLLALMDIRVERNAFGRQRESFSEELEIKGIGKFNCVFIRSPAILKAGKKVEVLAKLDKWIVAARQGKLLATAFHPELSGDMRMHEYFLKMCKI